MTVSTPPGPTGAGALSTTEQALVCSGADFWVNHPAPGAGVGAVKVTDGPIGARGAGQIGGGTPALCLPCPTAMAATWDPELVAAAATELAVEVRDRAAHGLLAPTVNLHRTPLAGRNFECFSEDPLLTARMAGAYITGVQAGGVAACVKHFVANDQETNRMTVSAEVDERTLREVYLVPFEHAVRTAGVWMVMAAYNRLGGIHCSEHEWLLTSVLRNEWGFDGVVVSDWFATHSTGPAALAGLDWEMPGPPVHFGARLADAVNAGEVPADHLRVMADRMLTLGVRTGAAAHPVANPDAAKERSEERPAARDVARQVAEASMVLLKNDGVLPLEPAPASLAVIGPNASVARPQGGGSAQVNPHRAVSPLAGITERLAEAGTTITHEVGTLDLATLPLLRSPLVVPLPGDHPGVQAASTGPGDTFAFEVAYFDAPGVRPGDDTTPVHTGVARAGSQLWAGMRPPGCTGAATVRMAATLEVPAGSRVRLGISSVGPSALWVDGECVIDAWDDDTRSPGGSFFGMGSEQLECELVLGDPGDPGDQGGVGLHRATLEFHYEVAGAVPLGAGRVGAMVVPSGDSFERAVAAARHAEVAVVVVGLDDDTETEGEDRETLALPGRQDALVDAVAAVNPRTVVVVNAGAPVHMPWRHRVGAVVQAWYPGQEGGHALAAVLTGDVNPSGRLPTTFPADLERTPAHGNFPGSNGTVTYAEGVFVGHRWFDANDVEPEWCFGHGLSYTDFAWADAQVQVTGLVAGPLPPAAPGSDQVAVVEVAVTNTGDRDGHEVVQVYLAAPPAADPRLVRPPRTLAGFARVWVPAGATEVARIGVDRRAWAVWDPTAGPAGTTGAWVVPAGVYHLEVAASSRRIVERLAVEVANAPGR